MTSTQLYLLCFVSNAAILVFEITGGRLLAPYLGTSVGVWAGLIAVVLGGMALGYHYGGKFGDQHASKKRIGFVFFLAGCTALLAWSMRDPIPSLLTTTPLKPTLGALLIGTVLFLPTIVALASISPLLAKNLIKNLENSAQVIGTLNAIGTIGAIVGAIATGMFLIPSFGVGAILLGVALSLFVTAIAVSKEDLLKKISVLGVCVLLALFLNTLQTKADGWVADISTAYNRIVVTREDTTGDTLAVWTSPFGIQCQMFVDESGQVEEYRLVDTYQKAHATVIETFFNDGPPRALFLGGCVGAFPRYILREHPETTATVVEIDPSMVTLATTLFGFDESSFPTLSFVYEDARVYVNTKHGLYDLVYLDAFGSSGRVPFQLMTKEMFEGVYDNLNAEGVLILNTHGAYEGAGALYPSVYVKTIREVFPTVGLYQFTNKPLVSQNLVIIASKTRELPASFESSKYPDLILSRTETREDVITLTDDYAPVEGIFLDRLVKFR